MTLIQTVYLKCIVFHAGKPEAHSAEVGALVPVFKISDTELKPNLLRCKNIVKLEPLMLGLSTQ